MSYLVIQQGLMQIVWFACVLGAARGIPWLGTTIGLAFIAFHRTRSSSRLSHEAGVIAGTGAIGAAVDVFLLQSGTVAYTSGLWLPGFGPHWMVVLWMAFGATLNVAHRWLHGRWLVAALLGAVFGPLSYLAGARLGGVAFPLSAEQGMVALALTWLIAMPAAVALAARLAEPLQVAPARP
mgnify:CR=1 FL=1